MSAGSVHLEVGDPRVADRGHAEFTITVAVSELLPGQLSQCVVRWSVMRRFSEFVSLHAALVRQYGLLLDDIALPPKQWLGTSEPDFIVTRARALHAYMQAVQRRCRGVAAFEESPHLASLALRAFLKWDERLSLAALPSAVREAASGGGGPSSGGESSAGAGSAGSGAAAAPVKRAASSTAAARVASRAAILGPIAAPSVAASADAQAVLRAATAAAPSSFVHKRVLQRRLLRLRLRLP